MVVSNVCLPIDMLQCSLEVGRVVITVEDESVAGESLKVVKCEVSSLGKRVQTKSRLGRVDHLDTP